MSVLIRADVAVRFENGSDRTGGLDSCWRWIRGRNDSGAGVFYRADLKKLVSASRFAWQLANGGIPLEMHVCHHCDNPPCVNPAHLFLGTRSDNMRDMFAKGRGDAGRRPGEPRFKLTSDNIADIHVLAAAGAPIRAIARKYGVWPSTIRQRLSRSAPVEVKGMGA